MSHA
jgi:hypothetical protein